MRRREFIARSAAASTAVLAGCGTKSAKKYDLLIVKGLVFDGRGNPGVEAAVAVNGDKVVAISTELKPDEARTVIDARGMAVSPGFIDPHTHTDIQLLVNPPAESKIRQGVTTEIGGNCGGSYYPIGDANFEEIRDNLKKEFDLDLTWRDIEGFFSVLEQGGSAVNYATLVGNGSLRSAVVGPYDRRATPDEMAAMKRIIGDYMDAGAVGMSSGLEYTPSSFADARELAELCAVIQARGGVHASHIRSESDTLLESLDEIIGVARQSGVRTEIAHFKAAYEANWHKIDDALMRLQDADREFGNILADRYTYDAYSTGLGYVYPIWAKEGTTEDFLNRLRDKTLDAQLRAAVGTFEKKLGTWDRMQISEVTTDTNRKYEGMTILAAAGDAGKAPYDFIRDILIEEKANVGIVGFAMSEENLMKVLAHPLVMVGSDGNSAAPYGPLGTGKPHPRYYGTFPRMLGRYVRERNVVPLETAIMKMTSMPAAHFGFNGRGILETGAFADITVFDPATVIDRATFQNPHQYPEGIPYVVVNGTVVISEGEHTGELPGRILRHTSRA